MVSNSNYGKSVEEVTALMAEKETLLAQDQNANESDPEASTEEISSRVNVPTEEEEAMEELRSTRESNQMEDENPIATRLKRAERQKRRTWSSKRVCSIFSKTGAILTPTR